MRVRPWIVIAGSLAVLYVGGGFALAAKALPATREGITYLQLGQERLFADPAESKLMFERSTASFEAASAELQSAPFAAKLSAPLPPFRWYVSLLKSLHALSLAGNQASSLSASFPVLVPEGQADVNGLLATSTSRYAAWYGENDGALEELQNSLDAADRELGKVPAWILFANRDQLITLRSQVGAARSGTRAGREVSRQALKNLGLGTGDTGNWLLLLTVNGRTSNYGTLATRNGSIASLTLAAPGSPLKDPASRDFFPLTAQASLDAYGKQADTVLALDASLLRRLLTVSGPLTLSSGRLDAESVTADSLSTPVISELLPLLINGLAKPADGSPSLLSVLSESFTDKSVSVWSRSPSLQAALDLTLPGDAPFDGNWIKVSAPGAEGSILIQADQKAPFGKDTVRQTVRLSGTAGETAVLHLPAAATSIEGGQAAQVADGSHVSVSAVLPATVTYDLPDTPASRRTLHVLKAAGRPGDFFSGFGHDATVTKNLTLTR